MTEKQPLLPGQTLFEYTTEYPCGCWTKFEQPMWCHRPNLEIKIKERLVCDGHKEMLQDYKEIQEEHMAKIKAFGDNFAKFYFQEPKYQ